jgi:argininosuccinate lyase
MGLWGGVFNEPTDDDLRRLNDSLPFDRRLYREDIQGSIAYAQAIATAGVLTHDEAAQIEAGLRQVLAEFEAGTFAFKEGDEDIHTAVERRLVEIVGAVGGKLHTGRSRNDQVATDFRLWCMAASVSLAARLRQLQRAVVGLAEAHTETLMPGYTHLQPAQPLTVAHWIMSYFWMLERDIERLEQARQRMNQLPLGAGALAGTPLPLDRHALAAALGFSQPVPNSLDAVSDRDFVADLLYIASLVGVHLSRLAEDIILFVNPAFGYFGLHDRYSTGSSLMPQKRNADPMELTRGKAGRLIGNLSGLLATLKGLPTGYNKDIQEDKEALFDSLDTLEALLPVVTGVVATLKVRPEALRRALAEEMLATDLADYLVARGMPFREAHHVVGRVVRWALEAGVPLSRVPLDAMQAESALFSEDVYSVFDFAQSVAKRAAFGGTAPAAVREQIAQAKALVGDK